MGLLDVTMPGSPSTLRLLARDHIALGLTIFTVACWLIALVAWWWPAAEDEDPTYGWLLGGLALAATVGCGGVVVHRLYSLRRLLTHGVEIIGKVEIVAANSEDVWYVILGYPYGEQQFQTKNVTGTRPELQVGQSVPLLVDPDNPSRAIVRALYEDAD